MLSFVAVDWRAPEKLEPVLMEVKLVVVRLRAALHGLTEFGEGALGNATRSEDRNLALKLRSLVRALRDANKLIRDASNAVETQGGWTLEHLARHTNDAKQRTKLPAPDSLDQLIACAQTLTEDVRQITSFIQGNASLLFNCQTIAPDDCLAAGTSEVLEETPDTSSSSGTAKASGDWLEDYDYVSFESKAVAERKNSALREAIPPNLKQKFDTVLKAAETTAVADASNAALLAAATSTAATASALAAKRHELCDKDKLLVRYYAVQISTHMGSLRQAIDSFLETVEKNQPPKFFIAYGKFVVVSAHNLVTIGDIVHRNMSKLELRDKILRCTDALTEALRTCVNKSKKAAAHFPSVTAVQEMVDSVVDISHLASDLKTTILQAVQLTL